MERLARIAKILAPLRVASPAGFAIALHFRYAAPKYLLQAYAADWLDTYTREGLVLHDPVVRWCLTHTGAARWSALDIPDEAHVLDRAAAQGLRFGVSLALDADGSRSGAGFARSDRELSDAEIARLSAALQKLHSLTQTLETLTPAFHEALKRMSICLSRG